MYNYFISLLLLVVLSSSCQQKNIKGAVDVPNNTTAIFPVNNFIQTDINDVLATPYSIYKLTTKKPAERKDSIAVSRETFKLLANQFLQKTIATPTLRPYYRETVFHDLSTKSITITYSTVNHELNVQQVLILLDDATNKLKRVFILCTTNNKDSSITEQYNWKAGKSFQINRFIKRKEGNDTEEYNTVVWNEKSDN